MQPSDRFRSARTFQSTPPCGGRRPGKWPRWTWGGFQSTPPCGGRPKWSASGSGGWWFQSTPPCGGRQWTIRRDSMPCCCFNPRPRAGGDTFALSESPILSVSIHAPVRGATVVMRQTRLPSRFQSTPPCGGRPKDISNAEPNMRFQSTPPCGGRHGRGDGGGGIVWFQSTPPCGGRLVTIV